MFSIDSLVSMLLVVTLLSLSCVFIILIILGLVSARPVQMSPNRRSIVCEAVTTKKADSAAKRARQAEKRRVYNKAKKSEVRTRMKKVS